MASYHFSMKTVSRSAGRSSTAAAAYRNAEMIIDERTGEVHDYTRKTGVEHSEIVLPAGCKEVSRSDLWNSVELHHKRKDALVAREFEVALPSELSPEERKRLAVDFAREVSEHYGVAADVAVHQPSKEGDERNHHAHILLTACSYTKDGPGKKVEAMDPIHCKRHQIENPADHWRERWADLTNERLKENQSPERVDHRSLEVQGIERVPTSHLGPAVTGMERRGISTRVKEFIAEQMRTAQKIKDMIKHMTNTVIHAKAEWLDAKTDLHAVEADAKFADREQAKIDAIKLAQDKERAETARQVKLIQEQRDAEHAKALEAERLKDPIERLVMQVEKQAKKDGLSERAIASVVRRVRDNLAEKAEPERSDPGFDL